MSTIPEESSKTEEGVEEPCSDFFEADDTNDWISQWWEDGATWMVHHSEQTLIPGDQNIWSLDSAPVRSEKTRGRAGVWLDWSGCENGHLEVFVDGEIMLR